MPPLTTLMSAGALAERLGDPGLRVFDCRFDLADTARGEREYERAHIPGAVYAHLDDALSGPIDASSGRHPLPDAGRLADWLRCKGLRRDQQVVVYDDSGGAMAVRLWWLLRWLGHDAVAVLDGGWPAWRSAGLPTHTASLKATPGDFGGSPDPSMLVGTEQVLANLEERRFTLIDARTAARFRGESEPIDPVAGHIPGALNLPLQLHLDADGRFLPAARLHALYDVLLGDIAPADTACMCGSGVTACHNILAMEIAGLHGSRLYAGSWSEWIRDPARPVATSEP